MIIVSTRQLESNSSKLARDLTNLMQPPHITTIMHDHRRKSTNCRALTAVIASCSTSPQQPEPSLKYWRRTCFVEENTEGCSCPAQDLL